MARRSDILWLAGPTGYDTRGGLNGVVALEWTFIGGTTAGEVRRWSLQFRVKERDFSLHDRRVSIWERDHSAELAAFYRPVAVLRTDLPRRSLLSAIRAMLPAKEIAAATAISMRDGKP